MLPADTATPPLHVAASSYHEPMLVLSALALLVLVASLVFAHRLRAGARIDLLNFEVLVTGITVLFWLEAHWTLCAPIAVLSFASMLVMWRAHARASAATDQPHPRNGPEPASRDRILSRLDDARQR